MDPRKMFIFGLLTAWLILTPTGKSFGDKFAEKTSDFLRDMTKEKENENKENL